MHNTVNPLTTCFLYLTSIYLHWERSVHDKLDVLTLSNPLSYEQDPLLTLAEREKDGERGGRREREIEREMREREEKEKCRGGARNEKRKNIKNPTKEVDMEKKGMVNKKWFNSLGNQINV